MQRKLGVVLIGQTPRPDLEVQLSAALGDDVVLELRGALDGLSEAELDTIAAPRSAADTLIAFVPPERRGNTPETSGRKISKQAVEERVPGVVATLREDGFPVAMLFCAGEFSGIRFPGTFVVPSTLLTGIVDAIYGGGRLGVFMPLAEQRDSFIARWSAPDRDVFGVPLLPNADEAAIADAIETMRAQSPDFLILDCLGYTAALHARITGALHVPCLLAWGSVANQLSALLPAR